MINYLSGLLCYSYSIFITLLFVLAQGVGSAYANRADQDPKFIVIHLDAVSSDLLIEALKAGKLPNLNAFFGDEGRIDFVITYFPSKTPTIISSLREGKGLDTAILPGWFNPDRAPDAEPGEGTGHVGTFLDMVFTKSRLSQINLLYGLPVFDWLNSPAMINLPNYLEEYGVLQFYWYKIDTHGHFYGEKARLNALYDFDRQFGRLVKRLDDDVNVIIYSDHGMAFGKGIEADDDVRELLGDDLAAYSFPNLYLQHPEKSESVAKRLVEETQIDYAFFMQENGLVKGFHEKGELLFEKKNGKIGYRFDGKDPLGYVNHGYNGELLDREEWLKFSYNLEYPMAPVNLADFLRNPGSGDIITLFDEGKYHQTGYSRKGNHGGFTASEMVVPLLFRGTEVEKYLNPYEAFWLPELFVTIGEIDFERRPRREKHYLSSWYNFRQKRNISSVSISPVYRLRFITSFSLDHFSVSRKTYTEIWGKADLYRSYLARFWMGGGVEIEDSEPGPFLYLQHDLRYRNVVVKNSITTTGRYTFKLGWEATPWLAFKTVNFNSLGFRIGF